MCIATADFTNTGLYRAVYFDGPQSDRDHEGEDHNARSAQPISGNHLVAGLGSQIPVWVVYIGDDEAEPVSHLQHFRSFQIAEDVARHLARAKRLDLIHEANPD